jgi:MFS family permease
MGKGGVEYEGFGDGNAKEVKSAFGLILLGILIGALLFGLLLDYFGRKRCLFLSCFSLTVSTTVLSASVSNSFLYIALPLCGCALSGVCLSALLAMVEVTTGHYRVSSPAVLLSAVVSSYSGLGLVTTFAQQWRLLWMIAAVIWVCGYALAGNVLESPRYLAVVRGKYGQAREVLQKIAEINHNPAFVDMFEGEKVIGYIEGSQKSPNKLPPSPESPRFSFSPITTGITSVSQAETIHIQRYFYWHLFYFRSLRSPFLSCLSLCTCLFLSQFSIISENQEIFNYGQALGIVLSLWLLLLLSQRIGRTYSLLVAVGVAGVCCLFGIVLTANTCQSTRICSINKVFATVVFSTGLASITSAHCILLIYTIELFPSAIRILCLAAVLACYGALALVYPFFQGLLAHTRIRPVLISCFSLLLAAAILCFLKDTLGEDTTDYLLEEQEEMGKPADLSQIEVRTLPTLSSPKPTNPFAFQPFNEEEEA